MRKATSSAGTRFALVETTSGVRSTELPDLEREGHLLGVDSVRVGISLQPGTLVAGRYRLEAPLGRGGMGAVWSATHTVTRRSVAMKFVRGPAHARTELRRRFMREARAAAAVHHPHVVNVLDVFELDEETPVMVMDRLEGETLGERIERCEQLSLEETVELVLPAVSAVGTAHARGVVHRDLKPDNIFLARKSEGPITVKVLDFGIAKLTAPDADGTETGGLVTQTGSTLGTPCYMAPEQAVGEKDLDHRVDVWALGVILYECLSGVRPIDGESVGQVVMRLMSTGITPLERVVLGVPEDVTSLVGRMLSRERSKRPRDLREVARLLARYTDLEVPAFGAPGSELESAPSPELDTGGERVVVGAGTADALGPTAEAPSRSSRRSRWLVGLVAAVVLGAVAGVIVEASGGESKADVALPVAAAPVPAPRPTARRHAEAPAKKATSEAVSAAVPTASALPQPVPPKPRKQQAPKAAVAARPRAAPAARPRVIAKAQPAQPEPKPSPTVSSPPPPANEPRALQGLAETPPF